MNQSDFRIAIWIIFNCSYFTSDIEFITKKINFTIFLLVSTTTMGGLGAGVPMGARLGSGAGGATALADGLACVGVDGWASEVSFESTIAGIQFAVVSAVGAA